MLPLGHDDAAGALVALANSCRPAVVGLAAFTDLSSLLAEDALPAELHEYVAEELYASVQARDPDEALRTERSTCDQPTDRCRTDS